MTSIKDSNDTVMMMGVMVAMQDPGMHWSQIFDYVQLVVTVIGFLLNLITLITLSLNNDGFSRVILMLLWHQSLVDMWVCLQASVVVIQPFLWSTGIYGIDFVVCHAWHGQAFYWGAVTLSTYNLIAIAIERYMTVCRPVYMNTIFKLTKQKIAIYIVVLYMGTLLITHGTYLQTRLDDKGQCVLEYFISSPSVEKYFFFFVIFTYLFTYLIPALVMATLYGVVAFKLNQRKKDQSLGKSSVIEAASSQLTKTAVVVTLIFIATIGYDLHYYLLGYTGVTRYELNTPIQKAGVFLSNTNSCVNPIIYMALMPLYRHSIKKTFCCCKACHGCSSYCREGTISKAASFNSNISIISIDGLKSEGVETCNVVLLNQLSLNV